MDNPIRDGYPWRGRRLAPTTLGSLLRVPIPDDLRPGGVSAMGELADLGAVIWNHLNAESCRSLADVIVDQVRQSAYRLPSHIARQRLPSLPPGFPLHGLDLSTRTYN